MKHSLNVRADSLPLSHCPSAMPASAGSSIRIDAPAALAVYPPLSHSPAARATVDTVKEIPMAWISRSLSRSSACR
ncbi:hypothetical protein D3C85_1664780 [compost metagenome]